MQCVRRVLAFDFLDACLSVRADDPLALLTAACRADMGTLARIEGFSDPWEKPLRFVHPDKLKKLSKEEKEARLLVAAWQGRQDEVGRVMNSGKPAPRTDTVGMSRNEEKVRIIGGGSKNPFGNSKAGRGKTVINAVSYPKDDLFRYGTPLHKAAYRGELDVCKELMAEVSGAKAVMLLDECSEVGNNPLHCAAFRGHTAVCEAILETLADAEVVVNRQGQKDDKADKKVKGNQQINASIAAMQMRNMYLSTPIDKAREANQKETLKLFERWPANLKLRDRATLEMKKIVDEYEKRPRELDTNPLRALLLAVDKLSLPRVKPDLVSRAKQLLHRAEDMQS